MSRTFLASRALAFCILLSAFRLLPASAAEPPASRPSAVTGLPAPAGPAASPRPAAAGWLDGWREETRIAGAMSAVDFLAALDAADPDGAGTAARRTFLRAFSSDPRGYLRAHGLGWTLLLVVLAGVLLNLTPCVLPMIPVNLALIGAGVEGSSRRGGAALGGAYGAGIALAHGIPGAAIVAAGGGFLGALQSSPWFSLSAAVLFLVLSLALFDVLAIDLTRWRRDGGATTGFFAAVVAGAVSVLFAGACIEPATLAVLLLAGDLFASGIRAAVLLPFALGIGMALPWPFLGAGLARLPAPGRWMEWVKRAFAVFVLLLAASYARLAWKGFRAPAVHRAASPAAVPDGAIAPGTLLEIEIEAGDRAAWDAALDAARASGRPALVDFGASWCRNCSAMDRRFETDPALRERLGRYAVLRVRVERPRDPAPGAMLDALGIRGLPTFLVLRAE